MERSNGRGSTTINKSILIVDDDAGMLALTSLMLERAGFSVQKASSGLEALELAERSAPDLFLLDIMMPDMNGIELCKRIRSSPRMRHTPVVLLSAHTDRDIVASGFEAGATEYLAKPVSHKVLVTKIKGILGLD